jgi:hypothetical protein
MADAGLRPRYREIAAGLTMDDGLALERKMIAKIGRFILGTGPLANIHGGAWEPGDPPGLDAGMAAQRAARTRKRNADHPATRRARA